ncbi:MAG: WbqC family protein [Deltaproteobacteria bacterium]|nr:WbqC family protein [Deltaproteobacteria bacterium]
MIVAIHQPQFMPWLGYFGKMAESDMFVLLDNVQYKKNEYQNRNRIKTSQGWQWLTLPVNYRFPQKINEVGIDNKTDWRKKHLHAIELNYGRSPYFNKYIEVLREFYSRDWRMLSDFNISCVRLLRGLLGISAELVVSSEMDISCVGPNERLVEICGKLGADTYLAGRDGRNYMDLGIFREAGLKVAFQEFEHPVYPQLFGGFERYMSGLDLIFNCGDNSIKILSNVKSFMKKEREE